MYYSDLALSGQGKGGGRVGGGGQPCIRVGQCWTREQLGICEWPSESNVACVIKTKRQQIETDNFSSYCGEVIQYLLIRCLGVTSTGFTSTVFTPTGFTNTGITSTGNTSTGNTPIYMVEVLPFFTN